MLKIEDKHESIKWEHENASQMQIVLGRRNKQTLQMNGKPQAATEEGMAK